MRIRIKFKKNGPVRFVGHLDIMRYFQKAMRRAGIDIVYTEGYSPHQVMSFASPLGLGLTSDGEYMDIEVNDSLSSEEAVAALNAVMADGIEVVSYVRLRDGAKKAMSAVAAADYIVSFKKREDFAQEEVRRMIGRYYGERDEIKVTKQGKKSERVIDLKPLIYEFLPYEDGAHGEAKVCAGNGAHGEAAICAADTAGITESVKRKGFFLRLSAGSADNIKPELVLSDFYKYFGREYDPFNMHVHRLELYERTGCGLKPLECAGDVIRT